MWKIKNSNKNPIKIAIAKTFTDTIGVFLKPGEFCICEPRMTASIDAQERRGFIVVDRVYDNSLKLALGDIYNESELIKASEETDNYKKS